ncbi:glycosyl transferase [Bradyrhizobium sp. CCBAU 051011]|uniref:glycosyltransferase n=1 Tax=Bradyrhizobium sp. CCBAU 051011 TaxID=858422 RepID=UPI0013740657|nr:glycosyltransferase family A protein [Bradyrhizobium sp. CCBAU 051011]QHO78434.1 glycosyl transferase [Bradyrhizobium sp. CCBAU 051011]
MPAETSHRYGVVAIGRNEGERLKQCLTSAQGADAIVYVDSGSTDSSVAWARNCGVEVIELDMKKGFTAARARNTGFRRLMELRPDLAYVQFVDGDCELAKQWPERSMAFLDEHPRVCAAFGRRRERHPEHSFYNALCDREWNVPLGEARFFGGDVMIRTAALTQAGGYREELIAGEEPELSVRLRAFGWAIWRLDQEMTLHDAAISRFSQWWLRMVRSGYAFAQGRHLHGSTLEKLWIWESRRAWLWGFWLPLVCLGAIASFGISGLTSLLVYPLQILRRMTRLSGPWSERFQLALFEMLARFSEALGQLRFLRDRLAGRHGRIVEYK